MRKIVAIILAFCMLFSFSGCQKNVEAKTFSSNNLSITLTNEFKESNEGYLTLYTKDIKVVIVATPTSAIGNLPLEEYAAMLGDSIGVLTQIDMDLSNKTPAYEYTVEGTGFTASKCLLCLYKTEDYYYHVTFSCAVGDYESNKGQFFAWVQSITV